MKKIFLLIALSLMIINSDAQNSKRRYDYENNRPGLVLTLGGLSFMTAAILEGNKNYGSWHATPGNPGNPTYVVPNFWRQTPRQIVFCVGFSMTFTGLITSLSRKNRR